MKRRKAAGKRLFSCVLAAAIILSGTGMANCARAAKKIALNRSKATITVGKTVKLRLKNAKKKVKWSSSNKK